MTSSRSSALQAVVALVIAAAATSCGKGASVPDANGAPSSDRPLVKRPPIKTQTIADMCTLLPVEKVESVLGKLTAPPQSGEDACLYLPQPVRNQGVRVVLRIDPTGAQPLEQADGMLANVFARELSDGAQRTAPARKKREDGWDFVGGTETISWRIGHMAVTISGNGNFLLPAKQLNALALMVREQLPDLPVAQPGIDPNGGGSPPDPCALLERAEAEAILGKLTVEPYRSTEGTPLPDGDGSSCTYYTPGHHTLVLTPTRGDAKTMFDMYAGAAARMRGLAGGADAADPLDGPWDEAAEGSTGALYFLKAENMLELSYRMSSTDLAGAARLARKAVGRL
jgi:hypothetical protein